MHSDLVDQDRRERSLRRYMLGQDRGRIRELKSWLHGRPEDAIGNAVGRELGMIASDYLDTATELGVEP